MQPLLYGSLVPWYRLVDPPEDHRDETRSYEAALDGAISPRAETLLELGSGAGHNAFHLKRRFRCTLTDISEAMLGLSRELNPECEHSSGDMRTLRLGRTFDAVLVHDAVMYMTTEGDLLAAARTAFEHTRAGGAAVFAPDELRDTFREGTAELGAESGTRALRGLEWKWDADPSDDVYQVDYCFLLRDGARVEAVHDRHIEGLFTRATWVRVLESAGFTVEAFPRPRDDEGQTDDVFLCRKPAG
jgi:SAM-dependent methyltransferase